MAKDNRHASAKEAKATSLVIRLIVALVAGAGCLPGLVPTSGGVMIEADGEGSEGTTVLIFALILLFGMLLAANCAFASLLATAILGGMVLVANLLAVALLVSAADDDGLGAIVNLFLASPVLVLTLRAWATVGSRARCWP